MKIDYQKLHDIISAAKDKFIAQSSRVYFQTPKGAREITLEEKRIVAILEAVDMKLGLGLEIEHFNEILEIPE